VSGAFPVIVVFALIAVLGALGLGLFSMARGGEFNARHGNKLMRLRVALQFAAIILIILAILASGR
jgi:hypothetical protein